MPRTAAFNFEPEQLLVDMKKRAKHHKHVASVAVSTGQLRLSPTYVRDNKLDGTFVKFYADVSKKVIGWQVMKETDLAALAGYRQLKCAKYVNKKTGQITEVCAVSIGKLLSVLDLSEKSYNKLPIQVYHGGMLDEDTHYIELKK